MEIEPIDDFERELRQSLQRRPAPPGLKRKVMARRVAPRVTRPFLTWERLAASLALMAILAGGIDWKVREQRRKEEAARDQVLLALRITSHALNQMNARLGARQRDGQD